MLRRLLWLSAIVGLGYAAWRWAHRQGEAIGFAGHGSTDRPYAPPPAASPAGSGERQGALTAGGPADGAAAGSGPRRIPTRVHRGSPPSVAPPAEAPAAPAEPASPEPAAEAAAVANLSALVGEAAPDATDLGALVGEAMAGEGVVDLAPLVSPTLAAGAPALGGPLTNINTADEDALIALPGIGPALARRIIAYREEHGPFASVDQLEAIQGIGPRNIDEFRHLVTV